MTKHVEEAEHQVVPGRRPAEERRDEIAVRLDAFDPRDFHPKMLRDAAAALTAGLPLPHAWRLARGWPGPREQEDHQIAIEVGATVTATVVRIENYGAFLQLEDGRMGLVHISEIDRNYVKDVREHLREGDSVEVKVTSIKDDGKIDLSIKALQDPAPRQSRRGTDQEFEQKLKKFMRQSEERQVDFRRATEHKRK
jgi:S1 RNA binding domain protein